MFYMCCDAQSNFFFLIGVFDLQKNWVNFSKLWENWTF